MLLAANAKFNRDASLYRSEKEKAAARLMKDPMSAESAFSIFGLLLGIFPPAAVFLKMLMDIGVMKGESVWLIAIMVLVNAVAATVGYFSGKLVGKIVSNLEKYPWSVMLLLMPFVGLVWGMATGGTAGVFIFILGAFFGAAIGGAVGAAALPAFVVFHRLLKKGDKIEERILLPLAFGVSLVISAFILGL
ncbi:MAG: hypothetical protein R2681_16415 [Pyrinomonadaceae bacterium]